MSLETLRKTLPAGPAPASLDRVFDLLEENHRHPMQKWIDYGWQNGSGTPLTWDFWQSKAPNYTQKSRYY